MSDQQVDAAARVVITASEVARVEADRPVTPPSVPPVVHLPPRPEASVPWWGILLGGLLTFCLPLLCIAGIAVLIALRGHEAQKAVWTRLLCTLLIISGLATSFGTAYIWFLKTPTGQPPAAQLPLGLVSHDFNDSFPLLPAPAPMTPVEIAARTKPLVFIVMPDPGNGLRDAYLENAPVGAATLLMADENGYLLGTNRHVSDMSFPFGKGNADRVLVVSSQGSYAYADVIARHQRLDLAMLWVKRRSGRSRFRQPITPYPQIAVGSTVFVIGHPQRLYFTLSSGLVSRAGGDDIVQLSAPISPGNSGGPAYDNLGNLLGIVTYAIDKQSSPNAENLNFATAADAFLRNSGWTVRDAGKPAVKKFMEEDAGRAK
jgi:hypothetical protein